MLSGFLLGLHMITVITKNHGVIILMLMHCSLYLLVLNLVLNTTQRSFHIKVSISLLLLLDLLQDFMYLLECPIYFHCTSLKMQKGLQAALKHDQK